MATKTINLRLVAYSDAAGKFDDQAPLNGNEDNFYVDDDLTDDIIGPSRLDTPIALSSMGCLLAVADGMGGQNAGEVASEIAVNTIAEFFKADRLTPEILKNEASRAEYIKQTIIEADRRVKAGAEGHPERFGMGSTIIISWIVDGTITTGWLGDSRCYRFNTRYGLVPVSRDHTYVQELADNGILSYNDTFGHPQGNIVTRSLGDPDTNPLPEAVSAPLYNGDIILMCSDGLSGVVPDRPMRDISDSIQDIMTADANDLTAMKNHLMQAAERQDWYDNVTVLLARFDGDLPDAPNTKKMAATDPTGSLRDLLDGPSTKINPQVSGTAKPGNDANNPKFKLLHYGIYAVLALLIATAIFFAVKLFSGPNEAPYPDETPDAAVTNRYNGSDDDKPVGDAIDEPLNELINAPTNSDDASANNKEVQQAKNEQQSATPKVNASDSTGKEAQQAKNEQASMKDKIIDNKWENLRNTLQGVKDITPWNKIISNLEDSIRKADEKNDNKEYDNLSKKVQLLVELRPIALEILNNLPNLSENKQAEAKKFIERMPKMKPDEIKEGKTVFSQVPSND